MPKKNEGGLRGGGHKNGRNPVVFQRNVYKEPEAILVVFGSNHSYLRVSNSTPSAEKKAAKSPTHPPPLPPKKCRQSEEVSLEFLLLTPPLARAFSLVRKKTPPSKKSLVRAKMGWGEEPRLRRQKANFPRRTSVSCLEGLTKRQFAGCC